MAKQASLHRGLVQLKVNVEQLGKNYNDFVDKLVDEAVVEAPIYMKGHARWKDNTGNRKDRVPGAARAGLFAKETKSPLVHGNAHKEITLSHSEWYGIFLETKDNGKFAIIMQAVKAVGESFMAKLADSLDRVARER